MMSDNNKKFRGRLSKYLGRGLNCGTCCYFEGGVCYWGPPSDGPDMAGFDESPRVHPESVCGRWSETFEDDGGR